MGRLFIIGGSDAGISAALRARELAPEWQVTVAVADRYPNFSICGIPYFLSREVPKAENLAHRKAADIQSIGVELLLDHRRAHRPVGASRDRARPARCSFRAWLRQLVVATGARSIRPPIASMDLPGVFLLRWMGDTFAFEDYLTARSPKCVIIVRGGYIGLEMAEALTRRCLGK